VGGSPRSDGSSTREDALLAGLAGRLRSPVLAGEEHLPVAPALTGLLGAPGLRRGSTVSLDGGGAPGVTSLALLLLAEASASGLWCGIVGLGDLGIAATAELGLDLGHLYLVPRPGRRFAAVTAELLAGFDAVLAAVPPGCTRSEARRLAARARERRSVLLALSGSAAAPASGPWPEPAEVRLTVTGGDVVGLRRGSGRVTARRLALTARLRRATPPERSALLWLPGLRLELAAGLPERRRALG